MSSDSSRPSQETHAIRQRPRRTQFRRFMDDTADRPTLRMPIVSSTAPQPIPPSTPAPMPAPSSAGTQAASPRRKPQGQFLRGPDVIGAQLRGAIHQVMTNPSLPAEAKPLGSATNWTPPTQAPLPTLTPSVSLVDSMGRAPSVQTPPSLPIRQPTTDRLENGNHGRPVLGEHEAFAFDIEDGDGSGSEIDELPTIQMMVLKGIANQQGKATPVMKSEVSGAAGAAAVVGAGNIAATFLKYGSNLMIQRGFGAARFGLYSLCMSVITLVASIFNFGLDDAMVRYVAVYRGKQQTRSLLGLAIFCTLISGVMGILGALLVLFLAPYIAHLKNAPDAAPLLQVMAPLVPFLCLQVIWSSGLQGFKAFKWRVISQRILPALVLIFLLIGVLIFFHSLNGVVVATVISTLVGTLLGLFFFLRMISRVSRAKPEPEAYQLREWLGFATPNFLTSIVDTVLESVDTLLLAFYSVANGGIGQYIAALRISTFIAVPLLSLNAMFSPTIAELHSKGENEKLTAMFKTVTKWSITLSLPIFCIATLFSVPLLNISGDDFTGGGPLLVALAIGSLGNTATGSVGNMLLMTGHQKLSFLNSLAAIVVNVGLGVLLTPHYGAMGTAISTGLAYAVVNLMRLFQVYILLKVQPYRWDVLKPIGAAAISSILIGLLLYLLGLTHWAIHLGKSSLSIQLLLIPVFLGMYMWLLSLFKLSSDDKIVVDAFRKKIKGLRRGKKKKK